MVARCWTWNNQVKDPFEYDSCYPKQYLFLSPTSLGGIKVTALLQVGINVGVNQKQLTSIQL